MLTAQEIKEKSFEKAVFGGYDMGGVDDFLSEISTEYAALQKENAVLKGKLKVLVEKVEEYRSTEDAMRLALLSAQKMSVQIENEAKERSEAMLSEAQKSSEDLKTKTLAESQRLLSEAKNAAATEQAKVSAVKEATGDFVAKVRALCNQQMQFLDSIERFTGSVPVPKVPEQSAAPAPAAPQAAAHEDLDTTVKSIEDSVAKLVEEPAAEMKLEEDLPAADTAVAGSEPTQHFSLGKEADGQTKLNFDDLRFGQE